MTPAEITRARCIEICKAHNLDFDRLRKSRKIRKREVQAWRLVISYLYMKGWCLSEIGRYLDRDHTTVSYHLEINNR